MIIGGVMHYVIASFSIYFLIYFRYMSGKRVVCLGWASLANLHLLQL